MDRMIQHNANGMKDIKKLPFDLEKALAGHPLVTRGGEIATDFKYYRGFHYSCSALICGVRRHFTKNGEWMHTKESSYDLFLLDAKPETMENNKELTLLEKFNAGWEIKAYGFKIVDVVKWKNGEHTAMDSAGVRCTYEPNAEHFTITPPVERRWVNVWTIDGDYPVSSISDKPNTRVIGSHKLTDQITIIYTENGWKLEK